MFQRTSLNVELNELQPSGSRVETEIVRKQTLLYRWSNFVESCFTRAALVSDALYIAGSLISGRRYSATQRKKERATWDFNS